MSWFTVGEIAVWLGMAALLGVVLGWLLHVIWYRSRRRSRDRKRRVDAPGPGRQGRIKGDRSSMIYHLPGSLAYEHTNADEWFDSEDGAVAAGFRRPRNR